jgi:ubiquinone/menaquinone biosynthesis C-methylase UbiE
VTAQSQKDRVRQANKAFYDLVADHYESIDGRRSDALVIWLTELVRGLRAKAPGGTLLDLGAGAGLVCRCASTVFERRYALDISPNILKVHKGNFDLGVSADVEAVPFKNESVDAVLAFATLHHLHSFDGLVGEMGRVLRPGGVFCSDHDMDEAFHDRFRWPLRLYRKLRNAKKKYVDSVKGLTDELYELSEFHEEGVDAVHLAGLFERAGFSVCLKHHWYGLNPVTDRVYGERDFSRGWAPLIRLWAVKNPG